jgi:hypothetical protein
MDASRWFRTVSVQGASEPVMSVLRELVAMLNAVQPTALDRDRSHVVVDDHDWIEYEVEVLLAHRADDEATVTLAVGAGGALLSWLNTHDHIYPEDGSSERPWTNVVVDAVAAVLRGEYEVEDHYRGDKFVKTTVRDLVDAGQTVTIMGSILSLLPFFGRVDRVERRSVSFDCLG